MAEPVAVAARVSAKGETGMTTPRLSSLTRFATALSASFALQACSALDGLEEDVSAGADAVSGSATESKGY